MWLSNYQLTNNYRRAVGLLQTRGVRCCYYQRCPVVRVPSLYVAGLISFVTKHLHLLISGEVLCQYITNKGLGLDTSDNYPDCDVVIPCENLYIKLQDLKQSVHFANVQTVCLEFGPIIPFFIFCAFILQAWLSVFQ